MPSWLDSCVTQPQPPIYRPSPFFLPSPKKSWVFRQRRMGGCCSRDDVREEGIGNRGQVDGKDSRNAVACVCQDGSRARLEGSRGFASMFTQQGLKGVNQDAMVLLEDFGGVKGTVFCGIFDGHGPYGHKVAAHVRDNLPHKLASHLISISPPDGHRIRGDTSIECRGIYEPRVDDDRFFYSWKDAFTDTFEELDKELSLNTGIDCVCSGTTAVCVVKHWENLLVANLGDSRAVLGTRDEKNKLVPIQLTVDLKPNLPAEAERINSCNGRVFALKEEPDVHRIWLPDDDCPGLAMARAFGDFCLKDYGLISTPQLSSWKLTQKDEFVVLATDGIWDVLSNKQVVKTVSSARNRSEAAKLLVHRAVRTWKTKYPTSKVDDCAVVCIFLNHPCLSSALPSDGCGRRRPARELSSESFKSARSGGWSEAGVEGERKEEWTALEGVSRVNSLVRMPRFAGVLGWRR